MSVPILFGLILPSRSVLVNATTISPTQYAFTFSTLPHFSHIVVFLLPGATLPEGVLTGIYIQLPNSTEFKFLGAIGTEKPSAIFKVNIHDDALTSTASSATEDEMTDSEALPPALAAGEVTLGLSIEPAANIAAQMETLRTSQLAMVSTRAQQAPTNLNTTKVLAQRIIKNAYNFLGSFAGSAGPGGVEVVPLKSFQDWWAKFERKVENDPGFLDRDQGD